MDSHSKMNCLNELDEINKIYEQKMQKKYNFDFDKGTPLKGKFEWKIDEKAFYEEIVKNTPSEESEIKTDKQKEKTENNF